MKTNLKAKYEAPEMVVVEIKSEGAICQVSNADSAARSYYGDAYSLDE